MVQNQSERRVSVSVNSLLKKGKRYSNEKSLEAKKKKFYERSKVLKKFNRLKNIQGEVSSAPQIELDQEPEEFDPLAIAMSKVRAAVEKKKVSIAPENSTVIVENEEANESVNDEDSEESEHEVSDSSESYEHGTEVCKFYLKGNCNRGSLCEFSHDQSIEENANTSASVGSGKKHNKKTCKFFLSRGGCNKGTRCKFLHEGNGKISETNQKSVKSLDEIRRIALEKKRDVESEHVRRLKEKEEKIKERKAWRKKMFQKTPRGQPLLKNRMLKILHTLEKDK